jgi:hypothetical protein
MNGSMKDILLATGLMAVLASCGSGGKAPALQPDADMPLEAEPVEEVKHVPTIMTDGDGCWSYDGHAYTMEGNIQSEKYDRKAWGRVTFAQVPADYQEFETLYREFLGKTPHGTLAMMPMAMELFARDEKLGEACIRLICLPSDVSSVVSTLKTRYSESDQAPGGSNMLRYLPAASLVGATPDNGYLPDEPYTLEMFASSSKHQDMQFMGNGRIIYVYLKSTAWDNEQRTVELVKQPDDSLHQVFNATSLYSPCKPITGNWKGLK